MAIDDNASYELTGAQVKDLANKIKAKAADNVFVGATSAIPGSKGLVPAPQAADDTKFLCGDGTWKTVGGGGGSSATVFYIVIDSQNNTVNLYKDSAHTTTATVAEVRTATETGMVMLELFGGDIINVLSSQTDGDEVWLTGVLTSYNDEVSIHVLGSYDPTDTYFDYSYYDLQPELTAGNHIDITGTTISAEGYIWGDDAAPATTPASTITSAMIVDGTIQATDIATGVVPIITMTDTDPGEGSPLAANNFVAVYGEDPSNMNYSLTEAKTGATWVDGSPIYKKTINFGALPDNTTKSVAHSIINLEYVIRIEGTILQGTMPTGNFKPIPLLYSSSDSSYNTECYVDKDNISMRCGNNRANCTAYVTIYYTKSS